MRVLRKHFPVNHCNGFRKSSTLSKKQLLPQCRLSRTLLRPSSSLRNQKRFLGASYFLTSCLLSNIETRKAPRSGAAVRSKQAASRRAACKAGAQSFGRPTSLENVPAQRGQRSSLEEGWLWPWPHTLRHQLKLQALGPSSPWTTRSALTYVVAQQASQGKNPEKTPF